jgi:tRNA (guanine37-N1)-methyltransferase
LLKENYLCKFDNEKLLSKYEVIDYDVTITHENYSASDILKSVLPDDNIPNSYEMIGNIAHLNLREKYDKYKYIIGRIILDKNSCIKTVINKTSKIDNVFRTYEMELLAGEDNFEVNHKEGNCKFEFDIRKVYWSSRLQQERDRLLKTFKKNDVLCDAFCGVGPMAIRAAKQGLRVLANDLNPECYKSINHNIKLNKLKETSITTFNMDAREFITTCIDQAKYIKDEDQNFDNKFPKNLKIDHIYMNLPKDAIEFLDVFVGLFKNTKKEVYDKGHLPIVHVYGFSNAKNPKDDLLERVAKAFGIESFDEQYLVNFEDVRDISNRKSVFCVSFQIPPQVAYLNN